MYHHLSVPQDPHNPFRRTSHAAAPRRWSYTPRYGAISQFLISGSANAGRRLRIRRPWTHFCAESGLILCCLRCRLDAIDIYAPATSAESIFICIIGLGTIILSRNSCGETTRHFNPSHILVSPTVRVRGTKQDHAARIIQHSGRHSRNKKLISASHPTHMFLPCEIVWVTHFSWSLAFSWSSSSPLQ